MPHDHRIKQYNRYKTWLGWGAILLILTAIAYSFLGIIPKWRSSSILINGNLGPNFYCGQRTMAITIMHDGMQEVLISNNCGFTFKSVGAPWPLKDSAPFVGIAPDERTIIALEHTGILHYKPADQDSFLTVTLRPSVADSGLSVFRGFVFMPHTDSILVYGSFPDIISFNLKKPGQQIDHPLKTGYIVRAMAADTSHTIAAVLDHQPDPSFICTGTSLATMDSLSSDPMTESIDSILYSFSQNKFYVISHLSDGKLNVAAQSLFGIITPSYQYPPSRIPANKVFIDTSGLPVYYGQGPRYQLDSVIDSIPAAGDIHALVLNDNLPSMAMLRNNGEYFLFLKEYKSWKLSPLLSTEYVLSTSFIAWISSLLVLALVSYLLYIKCQSISATIPTEGDIDELLIKSEKPLSLGDNDLLGFAAMETAALRIIRNPQIALPMTMVVSGSWGSGKSSMMNRIRERLQAPSEKKRFMTTWFNAWHLQGERSLLNSFLLHIIKCYEEYYAPFSLFRIKLALLRYHRLPTWKKFTFGFSFALIAGFFVLLILEILPDSYHRRLAFIDVYCSTVSDIFLSAKGLTTDALTPIGVGILFVSSLFFLGKQFVPAGLGTFLGLVPRGNYTLDVEKEEAGSREKFRQQYWEIVAAGRKGTKLVIFIDDLDRISGDKILELLEAINFISDITSRPSNTGDVKPNTIFVLGMHTKEVARLVGTQLKKINESNDDPEELGKLYIEKMIQLVIPVPFDMDDRDKLKKLYEN